VTSAIFFLIFITLTSGHILTKFLCH